MLTNTALDGVPYVWIDGEFVPSEQAQTHILTHALHYGLGVFEGIRAYKGSTESAVFRLDDHLVRLLQSAHILQMDIPYSIDELREATLETLRCNKLEDGYIRPISYLGFGAMGLAAQGNPVVTAIAAWPWGAYLGEEGLELGIRLKTSSFNRQHINTNMTKAKATGFYVNSIMAKREALAGGYDEALMLNTAGTVSECSGENVFVLIRGKLVTPPLSAGPLDGITRATVIEIAQRMKLEVIERDITRDEIYIADEMFLTGTAAEITPVRELDDRRIGQGYAGPITKEIQKTYFDLVHGRVVWHQDWLSTYKI